MAFELTLSRDVRRLLEGAVVKKRTVTTIEMRQIVTVRRSSGATRAWCPACLMEVEILHLEEAALMACASLRDICRRVCDGHIHLIETASGAQVCLGSLLSGRRYESMRE